MTDKVLIITGRFPPDTGGIASVACDYAGNLVRLGYNVTVLTKHYPGTRQYDAFQVLEVPDTFGKKLWICNYGSFLGHFDLTKYDHIILNGTFIPVIAGTYFSPEILSRCILIIQGLEVETIYKNRHPVKKWYYALLRAQYHHKRAMIQCRKIVSVSNAHKNKVIKAAKMEPYTAKFQIVYTGIDRTVFSPVQSDFRIQNNLTENHTLLITVSRIEKMKGFPLMLSLFKSLTEKDRRFRWIIIGDGPFLDTLKETVSADNLSDFIMLPGKIAREQLAYYYSAADCFWLLSDYDESFGLVYLEAQACGIPAIGYKKGGVVETIIHTKTGFLVESGEECLDLLLNRSYRHISKKDMEAFVQGFDQIKAAQELIQ